MSINKRDISTRDSMAQALALVGPTGIGKTKLSLELASKYCDPNECLFVRDINDLKTLKAKGANYKLIVFDDISYEFRRPEELIHLTDPYYPATVRILRETVHIRADIKKIFTHNSIYAYKPTLCQKEQELAIKRRLRVAKVDSEQEVEAELVAFLNL